MFEIFEWKEPLGTNPSGWFRRTESIPYPLPPVDPPVYPEDPPPPVIIPKYIALPSVLPATFS